MRIGLFGGTFDPIHRGHVEPVVEAAGALDLERVIYLPTASPPHKGDRSFAPPAARYTMVELALLDRPGFEVSDVEMSATTSAYTIDSIEHFERRFPEAVLVLLIGEDALRALPGWRRWRDIVGRVELGVLARPGAEASSLDDIPPELDAARRRGRVRFVDNEPLEASSSRIRRLLAAGEEPPAGQLAPLVLKYLAKYPNLYA